MERLSVVKIGGNIIDHPEKLSSFLKLFARIPGKKLLVHGGGKLSTQMAAQLSIPQQLVDGRRITDEATLKVVTMVYAGYINKNIVAGLQAAGCNAVGLSGADGNAIQAHKRQAGTIDYGFAGDIDQVNAAFLQHLLEGDYTLVLAPITHDQKGQLLNTNADTIAQETAKALSTFYEVELVYAFEKAGVLRDPSDNASVISRIDPQNYVRLKEEGIVSEGMIPKLDNAFAALQAGVSRVIIGPAEELNDLLSGHKGTSIVHGS